MSLLYCPPGQSGSTVRALDLPVFAAVLLAAVLHATWNALVKNASDKFTSMSAVVIGHLPFACIAVTIAPLPDASSWPYVLAGAALHVGYQLFLLLSYRVGELSHVYPIARGVAPMLVAGVSVALLGVRLSMTEMIAVLAIGVGIVSLVFVRGSEGLRNPRAATMALITGGFIAAYSLVDGLGAREAGTALGFLGWLSIINSVVFLLIAAIVRRGSIRNFAREGSGMALFGGGASFIAYSLVVWAFTQAPIALVTALRETSIIAALLIGVFFLGEKLNVAKLFSTTLTVFGAILLRLSR